MVKGDPKNTLVINQDLCIECGVCLGTCPVDAISETDEGFEIDAAECLICSQCLEACPTQAMDPMVNGKLYERSHV